MMKELQKDDPWSVPFIEAEAANVTERLLRDPLLGRVWFIAVDGQTVGYIVMAFDFSLEYRGRGAWIDEFFVRRTIADKASARRFLNSSQLRRKNSEPPSFTSRSITAIPRSNSTGARDSKIITAIS